MNYSQQIQRYNCEACYKAFPAGEESPCWTVNGGFINQYIFCRTCKRGNEISSLASYLNDPNSDRKKTMKILETSEFRRWKENTRPLPLQSLFSEEDAKKHWEEAEGVRWNLPKRTEK